MNGGAGRERSRQVPGNPVDGVVRLTTSRLVMRQWYPSDRGAFAELNADPEVMEFFPDTLSREESDTLARRLQGEIAENGWGLWALEVIGGEPFVGFVGLSEARMAVPFCPCIEIGWRLAKAAWGRGYATEAALVAMDYGIRHLGLDEIYSFTAVSNIRSEAVMRRLGMSRTGTFEHPNLPQGHRLRRHVLYRIGAGEISRKPVEYDLMTDKDGQEGPA